MQIRDILEQKGSAVQTIAPTTTVLQVLRTLNEKHIGTVVVVNKAGQIEGIVSERDILRNLEGCAMDRPVTEIMTPKDKLIIGHLDDSVEYALNMFTKSKIRHLPIIDGDRLVGIVSIGDAVKSQLSNAEFEKKALMDYITGSYAQ
ncbi:MAG TPA: CBS domain-containing protein [Spirochaetia bacterium]|nr:CBS domain-containing protein [Spirochaetia bacterium]